MVNKIWGFFILVGIMFCLFTSNISAINKEIISSGKTTIDMMLQLFPVIALWLGIINIAKESGLLEKFTHLLMPLLRYIFPDIPEGHESLGFIASNMVANMFGLGSAATPFGLKAMKSLQTLNDKKDTASKSMITFLVLNTSCLTIIPTTIISLRTLYGSNNPTEILLACLIATTSSTIFGFLADRVLGRVLND